MKKNAIEDLFDALEVVGKKHDPILPEKDRLDRCLNPEFLLTTDQQRIASKSLR